VREALEFAATDLGLHAAVDQVLMPAMRRTGSWQPGNWPLSDEHQIAAESARHWLHGLRTSAPGPVGGGPVVLSGGQLDNNNLRMEALATVLAHERVPWRMLPVGTAAHTVVDAVEATSAAAAVVVSNVSVGRRYAVAAVRAAASTGVPVFFVGDAFLFAGARKGVPGTYLDGTLTEGAAVVARAARAARG
jgi:hypothetical protein